MPRWPVSTRTKSSCIWRRNRAALGRRLPARIRRVRHTGGALGTIAGPDPPPGACTGETNRCVPISTGRGGLQQRRGEGGARSGYRGVPGRHRSRLVVAASWLTMREASRGKRWPANLHEDAGRDRAARGPRPSCMRWGGVGAPRMAGQWPWLERGGAGAVSGRRCGSDARGGDEGRRRTGGVGGGAAPDGRRRRRGAAGREEQEEIGRASCRERVS